MSPQGPAAKGAARLLAMARWALRLRYARFAIVGAGGTLVNMAVLTLGQEHWFRAIEAPQARLYVSLALAIAVATIHNFSWNRLWTWADRQRAATAQGRATPWATQLARYALASWLGSAMQYGLTLWLAHSMHYLVANLLAIVVASVSNYLANDWWTFRHRGTR